jgi:hypothetical protein
MDIVAILKECIEISKKNVLIFVPTIIVGLISFLLAIVLLGGNAATMAVQGGSMPMSTMGAMMGGATLVLVTTSLLGLIACAMTIGMAQEALTRGTTSLNTGMDVVKRTLIPVVIASILLCIIIGIGFMLLILPGLVALFFLLFTLPAVVLDNFAAVDAIKKSIDIVKANMSDTLILLVALIVIWIIFAIVRYLLNFIPLLGPLVGAFLGGIVSGYVTIVIVRCYRIFVPAS